jgi:hypothetical protein
VATKGTVERYKQKYLLDLKKNEAGARAGFAAAVDEHLAEKKLTAIANSADSQPPPAEYYPDAQRRFVQLRDVEQVSNPVMTLCKELGKTTKWFRKCFRPWSTQSDK